MESGPAVGQVSTSLDICVYYTITALETQGPDHGHKTSYQDQLPEQVCWDWFTREMEYLRRGRAATVLQPQRSSWGMETPSAAVYICDTTPMLRAQLQPYHLSCLDYGRGNVSRRTHYALQWCLGTGASMSLSRQYTARARGQPWHMAPHERTRRSTLLQRYTVLASQRPERTDGGLGKRLVISESPCDLRPTPALIAFPAARHVSTYCNK
ncbi:hypothetical protein BJ166DRAFT_187189 [Pestalotiopsis sp. NC0098]|nr:hypothetical protein BJ166DRAFT_187189 [Pestalotiopsis sp. NC0098]